MVKYLVMGVVWLELFYCSFAFGGFLIQIEGQLVKQDKKYVVLKSRGFRYKINKPTKESKAFFLLSRKDQDHYVLKADHTLIIQKRRENRLPAGAENVTQEVQEEKTGCSK